MAVEGAEKKLNQLRQRVKEAKDQLEQAEQELSSRMAQIYNFEGQVNARLGDLYDQLEDLEKEVAGYLKIVERHRNKRIYGEDHPFDEPDYWRNWESQPLDSPESPLEGFDEGQDDLIKELYRQLARLYHPDLAEDEADLDYRKEKMRTVNQAYQAQSLGELKYLALEAKIPTRSKRQPISKTKKQSETQRLQGELNRCQRRMREIKDETDRMHLHPSVQLSLDVTFARREGRDLLAEMARDLQQKVARKVVERDYLKAQLAHLDPED
jgi:hypothetical protein